MNAAMIRISVATILSHNARLIPSSSALSVLRRTLSELSTQNRVQSSPPTVIQVESPAVHQCPSENVSIQCSTSTPSPISSGPTLQSSFYRRPLPADLIPFSSDLGKKIFREAMEAGHAEGYFSLAEQFTTQSEPAFCGLSTLTMVLNSLALDPNRLWKGNWRWYSEEMLDCCAPLSLVKENGITFDEFACLAKCNGAIVKTITPRNPSATEDLFRAHIKSATSANNLHIVTSFSRRVLGQTGDGHFSPIGAYHPDRDMVLVMDVARFKYPPYWVSISKLWASMSAEDRMTGKARGYFLLSRSSMPPSVQPSTSAYTWRQVSRQLIHHIPEIIANYRPSPSSVDRSLWLILNNLTPDIIGCFSMAGTSEKLVPEQRTPGQPMLASSDNVLETGDASQGPSSIASPYAALRSIPLFSRVEPILQHIPTAAKKLKDHRRSRTSSGVEGTDRASALDVFTHDDADLLSCRSHPPDREHTHHHLHDGVHSVHADSVDAANASTDACKACTPSHAVLSAEQATFLLLAAPDELFMALPGPVRESFSHLRDIAALPISLRAEVQFLREYMRLVSTSCSNCDPVEPTQTDALQSTPCRASGRVLDPPLQNDGDRTTRTPFRQFSHKCSSRSRTGCVSSRTGQSQARLFTTPSD